MYVKTRLPSLSIFFFIQQNVVLIITECCVTNHVAQNATVEHVLQTTEHATLGANATLLTN